MKIKTPTGPLELGEWSQAVDYLGYCYWLRHDLGTLKTDWAREFGFGYNNSIGFHAGIGPTGPQGSLPHYAAMFFGKDVNFMVKEWRLFDMSLSSDVEKAKKTMDNFLQIIAQ